MKKSDWKRTVKTKIKLRIKFKKEQKRKLRIKPNQLRTVTRKVGKKDYMTTCDSDLVKDYIKIRLHVMWELKKNYPREEEDTKCPVCNQKEDTTEHVLEFQTAETVQLQNKR